MRRMISDLLDRLTDRLVRRQLDAAEERLLHPNALLRAEAQREAAEYVKAHMQGALAMGRHDDVLRISVGRAPADGLMMEFGVGGGDSIRRIAELAGPGSAVHGFDSFEGLPEDWGGRHEERGHYGTGGKPPAAPGNVRFHVGLFADTLPGFLAAESGPAAFIHIDCDLYSSTATVLEALAHRIQPGTIILFDEYFNYPGWQNHEHKAFGEFVERHRVRYDYLCWGFQQVAVTITAIEAGQ
jgi:hypothetical protein